MSKKKQTFNEESPLVKLRMFLGFHVVLATRNDAEFKRFSSIFSAGSVQTIIFREICPGGK